MSNIVYVAIQPGKQYAAPLFFVARVPYDTGLACACSLAFLSRAHLLRSHRIPETRLARPGLLPFARRLAHRRRDPLPINDKVMHFCAWSALRTDYKDRMRGLMAGRSVFILGGTI